jgi:hypothetical protein
VQDDYNNELERVDSQYKPHAECLQELQPLPSLPNEVVQLVGKVILSLLYVCGTDAPSQPANAKPCK